MRLVCFFVVCAILSLYFGSLPRCAGAEPPPAAPKPFGAIPTARQVRWHTMEFYGFLHFTVNTFTGKEWGEGSESPRLFNPSKLDARQWARVARDSGMAGLILTAKHHDGFCLWPSKYTRHSVKSSPWKEGKGDVIRELSEACKEFGLAKGVYLSPWDRNHADYGKPAYLDYYRNQLRELLSNYGPMFELWHDGANGGTGYYGGKGGTRSIDNKTYYDWPNTWALVRKLSPETVIFSDAGPDIRWVGNERGHAPETCWATIDAEGMFPGKADRRVLAHGTPRGKVWRPAEVDVSIRKGWFFHEDQQPKSVAELCDIYYNSVGHGACLLLNLTPDKRGLIPEEDVKRLKEFRAVLKATFAADLAQGAKASASNVRGGSERFAASHVTDGDRDTYWAADDPVRDATLTVELGKKVRFNRLRLQEYIQLGQRISSFTVEVHDKSGWHATAKGTTIGPRKILRFPTVRADGIRVHIRDALACPTLSTLEAYLAVTEPADNKP